MTNNLFAEKLGPTLVKHKNLLTPLDEMRQIKVLFHTVTFYSFYGFLSLFDNRLISIVLLLCFQKKTSSHPIIIYFFGIFSEQYLCSIDNSLLLCRLVDSRELLPYWPDRLHANNAIVFQGVLEHFFHTWRMKPNFGAKMKFITKQCQISFRNHSCICMMKNAVKLAAVLIFKQ